MPANSPPQSARLSPTFVNADDGHVGEFAAEHNAFDSQVDGNCDIDQAVTSQDEDLPVTSLGTTSPVRVCFMLDRLCHGGTEHWVLRLIHHLNRSRVVPSLCLLDGEDNLSRSLEPENCPVTRLGVKSLKSLRDWARSRQLSRFLREHRVDILQTHFPDSLNYGGVVAVASGVPHVVHTNFGDDFTHAPLLTRTVGRWANRLLAAKGLTAAVTNCEACRQDVLHDGWPENKPIYVVENGISLAAYEDGRWAEKDVEARAEGPFNVGIVAMLREEKCHDLLVQAAAIVRKTRDDVIFHLAGEGPMRTELEAQIKSLNLSEHVELHGMVGDVPEFLRHIDLAVLCSRNEGLPHAILEYMASRTPTIATAVGGNVEIVQDGIIGLLVPPQDAQALAEAVLKLVADPQRRHEMGQAAWTRVREYYSTQAMIDRFEGLYHRIAGRSRVTLK
ncbi:MAG: glycosyltransferase [Pirellulales bacterium]|nr:glycosyltransferase [Pirellulales bacterium]